MRTKTPTNDQLSALRAELQRVDELGAQLCEAAAAGADEAAKELRLRIHRLYARLAATHHYAAPNLLRAKAACYSRGPKRIKAIKKSLTIAREMEDKVEVAFSALALAEECVKTRFPRRVALRWLRTAEVTAGRIRNVELRRELERVRAVLQRSKAVPPATF
jgi:hypothetical protein